MPATRRTRLLELGWRFHRWIFSRSGGRIGSRILGNSVLQLTTVGRRSGQRRGVMLTYLDHGQSFVVFASNSGEPTQPVWYLNLEANPEAVAQVGSQAMRVRARVAEGAERSGLWQRIVGADPSYAEYQRRTERLIPVVILDRV